MARAIQSGLELSWHKKLRLWYRTVPVDLDTSGEEVKKRKYFGAGKSALDLKSYREALGQYNRHMDEIRLLHATRAIGARMSNGDYQGSSPLEQWPRENRSYLMDPALGDEEAVERDLMQRHFRAKRGLHRANQTMEANDPKQITIVGHVQQWLGGEKARWHNGEITAVAYQSKEAGIRTFSQWCGQRPFGESVEVERVLTGYRTLLLAKLASGDYTGNTINDKTKFLRQFILWAYDMRILDEMPRSLRVVVRKVEVQKGGVPLSVDQVQKLWDKSDERMRCFIALGLNCGFKNKDIAELRGEDLDAGRIISSRSKTKALMNYKLWPETLKLIERTRQDGGGSSEARLFTARDGGLLASGTLSTLFKKVAKRAGVVVGKTRSGAPRYATFEQLRDTGAELVKQSLLAQGAEMAIQQLYLAHRDSSTAAYYTSNDPRTMKSARLDAELERLRKVLGLKLASRSSRVAAKGGRTRGVETSVSRRRKR